MSNQITTGDHSVREYDYYDEDNFDKDYQEDYDENVEEEYDEEEYDGSYQEEITYLHDDAGYPEDEEE